MKVELLPWIVSNDHATSGFNLSNLFFIREIAQVINDKERFDTSFDSISQFLQCYSSHIFVVHGICNYANEILGVIDFLPKHIEEFVIVFINLDALMRLDTCFVHWIIIKI